VRLNKLEDELLIFAGIKSINISELKEAIDTNFPQLWPTVEACLSVISGLFLENVSDCIGINLQGPPSSEKTTALSFFYGFDPLIHKSDDFTPKSFVSHYAAEKKSQLKSIDLLPKIKGKCMIVPELAPLFGKRKEDLLHNLSILTRIFDGEGFESDSGVQGHRGYSGDHFFAWLGATTPISNKVWTIMGKLGARWFFWNILAKDETPEAVAKKMTEGVTYKEKVAECRKLTHSFLNGLLNRYELHSISWDRKQDQKIVEGIVRVVDVMRRLRAPLQVKSEHSAGGEAYFHYTAPVVEAPERATNILYNIARGRALIYERKKLLLEDLKMVARIALSSMPAERNELITLLVKHDGVLTTKTVMDELKCSQSTANRVMKTLNVLGLVDFEDINAEDVNDYQISVGRPMNRIQLKEQFLWIKEIKLWP